jgi:hypothetical protein
VKKFNYLYLLFLIILLFELAIFIFRPDEIYVSTLCVYDKTFVEFNDSNKVWGTMLLDDNGRTINCNDGSKVEQTNEIIKENLDSEYI